MVRRDGSGHAYDEGIRGFWLGSDPQVSAVQSGGDQRSQSGLCQARLAQTQLVTTLVSVSTPRTLNPLVARRLAVGRPT